MKFYITSQKINFGFAVPNNLNGSDFIYSQDCRNESEQVNSKGKFLQDVSFFTEDQSEAEFAFVNRSKVEENRKRLNLYIHIHNK